MPNLAEKKKNKSVNTMVMLFLFLIGFAILTHIIPSGSYVRENVNGRDYVIPNSYTQGGGQSIGFFDIFEVIPLGFAKGVALIFNFLAVGGAFEVLKSTGAINTGISAMIRKIGIKRGNIILVLLFAIFSTLGAFLGLTDAAIPFIPIAMSIALALGYDPLVALGVTVLGAYSGSMPGPTNPSSVGICHQIAGLVPFSGIGFRLVEWAIIAAVTLTYVMLYAKRVGKDYSNSLVADVDLTGMKFDVEEYENEKCTGTQKWVLGNRYELRFRALLKNPIMLSLCCGLVLFFTQIPLPGVVLTAISGISALNGPVAMIILGVYLASVDIRQMFANKHLYWVSFIRLLLIPVIVVLCVLPLPKAYIEIGIALTLAAGAPVGSNVAVYAQKLDLDYTYAVQAVCISSLLSLLSLPALAALAGTLS